MMQGRQLAWLIRDHFRTSATQEELMKARDLLRLKLKNDNIEVYLNQFDTGLLAQRKRPEDDLLEGVLFEQMGTGVQMKDTVGYYKMIHRQDKSIPKSYSKPRQMVDNFICEKTSPVCRE